MLPSQFIEAAGFPLPWREHHLQQYLGDRLKQRGYTVQLEATANGGRADIVTNWQGGSIIEVKKYLDRNTIYQAAGQLNLYGLNNTHKLVVMGFLTPDAREQSSALKTASMVEQNPRLKVVFVNLESDWLPGKQFQVSWLSKLLPLPEFSFPNFKFDDWHWWFVLAKNNPLVLVFLAVILMFTTHSLKQEFTYCKKTPDMWNCLFSTFSTDLTKR